jgi:hypothetical protein
LHGVRLRNRLRLSRMSVLSGGFKTIRRWDSASSRVIVSNRF